MPRRLHFAGTFSDSGDLNVLPLSCHANHARFFFYEKCDSVHLQNDHIKNEISLGEQLKFISDVECFESLEESCCILKEFTYQNC